MSNVPVELYAAGLVSLMDQQGVHRFEVDLEKMKEASNSAAGLSIEFEITETKLIISTGRCDCANCRAIVGSPS